VSGQRDSIPYQAGIPAPNSFVYFHSGDGIPPRTADTADDAYHALVAKTGKLPQWRLLTVTGFLGGLTTFSTFSAEVVTAILEGRSLWAVSTVAAHVLGSIILTLCGVGTVRLVRSLL
jgi:CrcB-like protein, Camphor Resistance (CrcB)